MKSLPPLLAVLALTGCGSIFDPAPYVAYQDPEVQLGTIGTHKAVEQAREQRPAAPGPDRGPPPIYTAEQLLYFESYDDAGKKLARLALGYASARNTLMQQQLFFDVPAIGLGVASVTSLAFRGAADATTALALAAASVTGSRTYFQPGTKVAAYNTAALSLECASVAAQALSHADHMYGDASANLLDSITRNSEAAAATLQDPKADAGIDKPAMMAARDAAQKTVSGLQNAIATLDAGPAKLQSFADATIRKSTSTVVSGQPSTDSIVAAIKASLGTSMPSATPAAGSGTATKPAPSTRTQRELTSIAASDSHAVADAQALTTTLLQNAKDADHDTQIINAAWAEFSACTGASS